MLVVLLDDVGFGASSAFGGGRDATVTLYVDGTEAGSGRVDQTEGYMFSADETCDVGVDDASWVSPDDTPQTSRFTGRVNWVELAIDEAAADDDHDLTAEERFRAAMAIQ